jgi:glycerol uptake facilitator-like aquaporin
MDFSVVNWLAVIVAAVVAWLFGAVWYIALSKPWMKAAKIDPANKKPSIAPFIISFVAEVVMAFVLTLVVGALTGGEPNPLAGVIFGFVLWLGFVATTVSANHRYQGFGWDLTLIDAGHWLGVLLIIGAIIGWFGAPAAPAG